MWYETQLAPRPEGIVLLRLAPELVAIGPYTRNLFRVPVLPKEGGQENMIAIGERRRQKTHYFLAVNEAELGYQSCLLGAEANWITNYNTYKNATEYIVT